MSLNTLPRTFSISGAERLRDSAAKLCTECTGYEMSANLTGRLLALHFGGKGQISTANERLVLVDRVK